MAREKTVYNTATEIKYEIFSDKNEEGKETVSVEAGDTAQTEKKEAPVKQKTSIWNKLKSSFSTEKMFNQDNEA